MSRTSSSSLYRDFVGSACLLRGKTYAPFTIRPRRCRKWDVVQLDNNRHVGWLSPAPNASLKWFVHLWLISAERRSILGYLLRAALKNHVTTKRVGQQITPLWKRQYLARMFIHQYHSIARQEQTTTEELLPLPSAFVIKKTVNYSCFQCLRPKVLEIYEEHRHAWDDQVLSDSSSSIFLFLSFLFALCGKMPWLVSGITRKLFAFLPYFLRLFPASVYVIPTFRKTWPVKLRKCKFATVHPPINKVVLNLPMPFFQYVKICTDEEPVWVTNLWLHDSWESTCAPFPLDSGLMCSSMKSLAYLHLMLMSTRCIHAVCWDGPRE